MADPASYASWKARRLRAGVPLASIEAIQPKPSGAFGGSLSNVLTSPQRETPVPGYMPPSQPFDYPVPKMRAGMETFAPAGDAGASMGVAVNPNAGGPGEMLPGMQSQGSAAVTGFVNPKKLVEGNLDPIEAAKSMSVFEQTGGKSPFGPVAPGGPAAGIPPGALANGFDPRFMNKPKAPLWR